MPLYEYGCPTCGTDREVQHPMSEIGKIEVMCDACGHQMKKLLSAPTLLGFDDVGRSISKSDKANNSKKEISKPSTPVKSSSKKDAA